MKIKNFSSYEFVWCFGFLISLALILASARYGLPSTKVRPAVQQFEAQGFLYLHIMGGAVWLISGFLQFTPYFQKRRPWHRLNGYLCYGSAFLSCLGLLGVSLSLQRHTLLLKDGIIASSYTFVCLLLSFYNIKNKSLELHRAWSIRSMVPAIEIPVTRLFSMIGYLAETRINFSIFYLLIFMAEIIVFRKLDFQIIKPEFGKLNYVMWLMYGLILATAFGLVFYWQYFLEHMS